MPLAAENPEQTATHAGHLCGPFRRVPERIASPRVANRKHLVVRHGGQRVLVVVRLHVDLAVGQDDLECAFALVIAVAHKSSGPEYERYRESSASRLDGLRGRSE